MTKQLFSALLLLTAIQIGWAADDAPSAPLTPPAALPATSVAEPAAQPNRIVCKRETAVGTHVPRRVCRSQVAIDEERAQAQRDYDRVHGGHVRATGGRTN